MENPIVNPVMRCIIVQLALVIAKPVCVCVHITCISLWRGGWGQARPGLVSGLGEAGVVAGGVGGEFTPLVAEPGGC